MQRDAHLSYKRHSLENFVSMAIQGKQVLMYTKHTLFLHFSDFSKKKNFFLYVKQNKAKLKNNQTKTCETTWKHERKMQMHESKIPKADKKSSKESPTLDRKN